MILKEFNICEANTPMEEDVINYVNSLGETTEDDIDWYNYEIGKWANARLSDGSLFVSDYKRL